MCCVHLASATMMKNKKYLLTSWQFPRCSMTREHIHGNSSHQIRKPRRGIRPVELVKVSIVLCSVCLVFIFEFWLSVEKRRGLVLYGNNADGRRHMIPQEPQTRRLRMRRGAEVSRRPLSA